LRAIAQRPPQSGAKALVNRTEVAMTKRRWLQAAITAATEASHVVMPFERGAKKRPAALILRPVAVAAR
jgi:hypothetical protein